MDQQPHINALCNQVQTLLPASNTVCECSDILATRDGLQICQLVLQQQFFLIGTGEYPTSIIIAFLVFGKVEILLLPDLINFVELLLVLVFLVGLVADFTNLLREIVKLQCEDLLKGHGFGGYFDLLARFFDELLPVPIGNGPTLELDNQWG